MTRPYHSSSTLERFHQSNAFVRGVRGPVGGGKSTAMCQEILKRAKEQEPGEDGVRRTRFAIVRNTYPELRDTTVKTWLEWIPEEIYGKFTWSPQLAHILRFDDVECEVLFRALDTEKDIKKVLSLELTGAWFNEAREIRQGIIEAMTDRVGRFPSIDNGGCTWRGIMLDTNSPDNDHWWFRLAEEEKPEGWEFFSQPAALIQKGGKWTVNPLAENLKNLEGARDKPPLLGKYYLTRFPGKREDYINVYYGNNYGFVNEGKVVYPEYSDVLHAAKGNIDFIPTLPIYIGIGLGLEPSAIFAQKKKNGQWRLIDEMIPDAIGTIRFAEALESKMKADFPPGTEFRTFTKWLRPSDEEQQAELQILRGRNIKLMPARTDDPIVRRDAVANTLNRLVDREPAILISPKCKIARKGMSGGYSYAKLQTSGDERFSDEPVKNRYRTLCEAIQYMMIGGGEDKSVFNLPKAKKLKYPEMGYA